MIDLTRLNGHRILVNCDLIKFIEAIPDTTISLVTGEKLIVCETPDELIERIIAYRSDTLRLAWPEAAVAIRAKAAHQFTPTE